LHITGNSIATAWSELIGIITGSGFPAAITGKSRIGIGRWPRIGVGTVETILWFMKIRIIQVGIWSTT